jgi:hypothetical protein
MAMNAVAPYACMQDDAKKLSSSLRRKLADGG